MQPKNDGGYIWTETENGEDIKTTEEKMKETFPELNQFNFEETFKYIPLTEDERKYSRPVTLNKFKEFTYDEKSGYIEFGNDLTNDQLFYLTEDLNNNRELIRSYINRLDEFLPEKVIERFSGDKSLMRSYQTRADGYIASIVQDEIMETGYPPIWGEDWARKNIDPRYFIDSIKKALMKSNKRGIRFIPPDWVSDWVKENANLFSDILVDQIKEKGSTPSWGINWAEKNLNPEDFIDIIKNHIRRNGFPPIWAVDYCIENDIGRTKENWIKMIKNHILDIGYPSHWSKRWVLEDPNRVIDVINIKLARSGSVHRYFLAFVLAFEQC